MPPLPDTPRKAPHRSRWPVAVVAGFAPSVLWLGCGLLLLLLSFSRSFLYAVGGNVLPLLGITALLVVAPILNGVALWPGARHGRLLVWLAAVPTGGVVLLAVKLGKEALHRGQTGEAWLAAAVLGFPGLAILAALAWSRIAQGERPQLTLGQCARITAACCVLLAAGSAIVRPEKLGAYRRQLPIAARFEALGGSASWQEWEVHGLIFRNSRVTDDELPLLAELPQLTSLYLSDTAVTDAGLAHLEPLTGLEHLYLDRTTVTDHGLARIAHLSELRNLWLSGTQVTDDGLPHLQRMARLGYLDLSQTAVTDRGLEHLGHLDQLHYLHLPGTQVSRAGIDRLHARLPRCRIFGRPGGVDYLVGP